MTLYPTYRIVCPDGRWELTSERYGEMDRERADWLHATCREAGGHILQKATWKTVGEEG